MKKFVLANLGLATLLAAIVIAIQLIPNGRSHVNPTVRQEPAWDSLTTRSLAVRACYDCHSNETTWPWYSTIAPISWLVQRDVLEGRKVLNFSEWDVPQKEAREAAESVQEGEMPQWFYVIVHPEAKLSATERQALIKGLQATIRATDTGRSRNPS